MEGYSPGVGVDLLKLNLVHRNNLTAVVEDDEAGAGGALVNGANKGWVHRLSDWGHGGGVCGGGGGGLSRLGSTWEQGPEHADAIANWGYQFTRKRTSKKQDEKEEREKKKSAARAVQMIVRTSTSAESRSEGWRGRETEVASHVGERQNYLYSGAAGPSYCCRASMG